MLHFVTTEERNTFKTIIMNKHLILTLMFCASLYSYGQKQHLLSSPDGNIQVSINLSDKIYYDIVCQKDTLLKQCNLHMQLGNQEIGNYPRLIKASRKSVDEPLKPVIALKYSTVPNKYNRLLLKFKGEYSVEFRAFDDGIAYRFITDKEGTVEVTDEIFQVNFPDNYRLHMQQPGGFKTAYEEEYHLVQSREWKPSDRMALLPLLVDTRKNYKILISESALTDYPALFLKSNGPERNVLRVP